MTDKDAGVRTEAGTQAHSEARRSDDGAGSWLAGSPLSEAVLLTILAVGVGNAFSIGVSAGLAASGAALSPLGTVGVSVVSLQGVGMLGTALAYLWFRGRWDLLRFDRPSLQAFGLVLIAFLAATVLNVVRTIVMSQFGLVASTPVIGAGLDSGDAATALLVLTVVSFVVIAPIEELTFRGVIQGRLRDGYGPTIAIIVASVLFAGMHLPGLTGSLTGRVALIAGLFAISLVFGWLYERTGTLVAPWLAHGLYNASLFALLYVLVMVGAV